MLRSIWRGALGVVVWGAMACAALAQTNVPQKPANYQSPSGAYVPADPTNVIGVDSVTGNACLIGLTATCGLPIVDPSGAPTAVTIGTASSGASGMITTGGTAQVLFRGATPTNGFRIAIPVAFNSINTFVCFYSDTTTTPSATTAGSFPVYAGGSDFTQPGEKPAGPVYLNCPTTGTVFSAKKW